MPCQRPPVLRLRAGLTVITRPSAACRLPSKYHAASPTVFFWYFSPCGPVCSTALENNESNAGRMSVYNQFPNSHGFLKVKMSREKTKKMKAKSQKSHPECSISLRRATDEIFCPNVNKKTENRKKARKARKEIRDQKSETRKSKREIDANAVKHSKQNDVKHINHKQISSKESLPRHLHRLRPITARALPLQSYWKRTEMDSPW